MISATLEVESTDSGNCVVSFYLNNKLQFGTKQEVEKMHQLLPLIQKAIEESGGKTLVPISTSIRPVGKG